MKIGVHLGNSGPWATAEALTSLAVHAERLGYDSVWVSDHVVIPSAIESAYPYGPPGSWSPDASQNYWEPFAVLAFIAGMTRRVELGTTVIVVPQRPPLLIAKQWATLDALSGGRTILGIGAGWMREEFVALGFGDIFDKRGPATDEAITLFRAAWTTDGDVSFDGEVYRFAPIRVMPKPARPGGPPIWIGGHGKRSIRRAAELGDGWHPIRMPLDELRGALVYLDEQLARYGRTRADVAISAVLSAWPPGSGPDGPPRDFDLVGGPDEIAAKVRAYEAAGVEHIVVGAARRDMTSAMPDALEYLAGEVRPRLEAASCE